MNNQEPKPRKRMSREYRLINRQQFGDYWIDPAKFRAKTTEDENGCHIWNGPLHAQGYGFVNVLRDSDLKRMIVTTHRLAMTMKMKAKLPRHDYVLHTCGNPACCNPDHLEIGDHRDMVALRYKRIKK